MILKTYSNKLLYCWGKLRPLLIKDWPQLIQQRLITAFPTVFLTACPGGIAVFQLSWGEISGASWTGWHIYIYVTCESAVNHLTCTCLDCGRKAENTQTGRGRTWKLYTERPQPERRLKPGAFLWDKNVKFQIFSVKFDDDFMMTRQRLPMFTGRDA